MLEPVIEKTYFEVVEEILDIFRKYRITAHGAKKALKYALKRIDKTSLVVGGKEDTTAGRDRKEGDDV